MGANLPRARRAYAHEPDGRVSLVESALHETVYMVGSATDSREFRDVDVRVIMNDDKFDALFGDTGNCTEPFWTLFCISVSAWLRDRTGLPVDFQVQRGAR